jgi:aminopeptidase
VPDDALLRRYADLVVRVGANVGEGQDVFVNAYVEHAPFARAITQAAYDVGARYVAVHYADQYVKRELIANASDDVLEWTPPWQLEELEYLGRVGGAEISIAGDPNPDVFSDLDGARVGKARPKELARRTLEILFEERLINWTIAAYPNPRWAEKVFGKPDVERLWDDVAKAVRLDERIRSTPGELTSNGSSSVQRSSTSANSTKCASRGLERISGSA